MGVTGVELDPDHGGVTAVHTEVGATESKISL